jgi:hypothetical protein
MVGCLTQMTSHFSMREKIYTFDKYYNFERPIDYVPCSHLTVEDEIRYLCKKQRIVFTKIIPVMTYKVVGTKVRSHKDCEELQKFADKNETYKIRIPYHKNNGRKTTHN